MTENQARSRSHRLAIWLTLADALLLGSVTAFVAALALWSRPLLDGPILFLWAALPVVASRLPRETPRWRRAAVILALLMAGVLGWRFISYRVPAGESIGWELQTALLIFWSSGFLIVQPLTYRLFDALALGAMTIGLLDGRPLAGPFVALAMVSWFAVLSLRHRYFDLGAARMSGRPSITAAGGFLLAMVFMSTIFLGIGSFIGREDLIHGRVQVGQQAKRRIGWGAGPLLSDLRPTEKSAEPFFVVGFRDRSLSREFDPETMRTRGLSWLWRMRVFDRFTARLESWTANTDFRRPSGGIRTDGFEVAPNLAIDLIRISAAAQFFPTLYGTADARLIESEVVGAGLELNSAGVATIVADGQISSTQGDIVELGWDGSATLIDPPGPEHLALPANATLRARLAQITGDWSDSRNNSVGTRDALGQFFATYFQYTLESSWPRNFPDQESRLLAFLTDQRRGDCNYFALGSCMVFRAVGIPARLAQGFCGIDWDEELQAYAIIEGSSHVWTEYWADGAWRPFDGTSYVGGTDVPRPALRRRDPAALEPTAGDALSPRVAQVAPSLVERVLGHDAEGSRLAMLAFVLPLLALLLTLFLRRSDSRARPLRSEIVAALLEPQALPEFELDDPGLIGTLRGRVILLYLRMQRGLARQGRQRRSTETPRRHAARLMRDHADTPESMIAVAELADRGFYGEPLEDPMAIRALEALEREFPES